MKRYMIWLSVALLLVTSGIIFARADGLRRHGWGGRGWSRHEPLGYVAHKLNLSHAQKFQMKSMWDAERPTVASLVQELASEGKEMDAVTAHGNLDDRKIEAIADRQGATIAKLLVEKERFKSKVYATVLNPEQRTKADQLQRTWDSWLDHLAARIGNGNIHESHN